MPDELDLVSKLNSEEQSIQRLRLRAVCADDGKYAEDTEAVVPYLSPEAEWHHCARMQQILLEVRAEFGQAEQRHVDEIRAAVQKIDPLNISLLEKKVTKHDQLAVIEELGRFVSPETKALLHPGTTSYDILDTVRAYLMRDAWGNVMRPKVKQVIDKLCKLAEEHMDVLQVGRTHLQNTSPVTFGVYCAGYAARLAERVKKADKAFTSLLGKISGIVGTGASIERVIGEGKASEFQERVLARLGLKPDHTASQIVQKERLVDVGNSITTMMDVLANFANDMRILYSSAIGEITDLDAAARLKGSSAGAGKNNPINWENIVGKSEVVAAGMPVLRAMLRTNFQRDLCNSVQARYQPGMMMAETYESFSRAGKALDTLYVNKEAVARNLEPYRRIPDEPATAITRGHGYVHPTLGVGHSAIAAFVKTAKNQRLTTLDIALEKDAEFKAFYDRQPDGEKEMLKRTFSSYAGTARLVDVALKDDHFKQFYEGLPDTEKRILNGELELYLGPSRDVARKNIEFARSV